MRRNSRSRSPKREMNSRVRERSRDYVEGRDHIPDEFKKKSKIVPNWEKSGKLNIEGNVFNGVELKYSEPPEARKGTSKFRLYVFKEKEHIQTIPIFKQSAYLIGRDKAVCDIPMDHGSLSKQHAVLQYRQIIKTNEYGDTEQVIKLYIIDLDSTHGTKVNGEQIPTARYYELLVGDIITLGFSTRELWDDSDLIRTWDLALEEYNTYYSMDPNVRKQETPEPEENQNRGNNLVKRNRKRKKKNYPLKKAKDSGTALYEPLKRQHLMSKEPNFITEKYIVNYSDHDSHSQEDGQIIQEEEGEIQEEDGLIQEEGELLDPDFSERILFNPPALEECKAVPTEISSSFEIELLDKMMKSYKKGFQAGTDFKETNGSEIDYELLSKAWFEAGFQTSIACHPVE